MFLCAQIRGTYDCVRIAIDSNHGKNFTCIYRIRIHGEAAAPPKPS